MGKRATPLSTFFLAPLICSFLLHADAQGCFNVSFSGNRNFEECIDLGRLSAQLFWTYESDNSTAHLAFRAFQESTGYVAWGLNPNDQAMVGTEALVAISNTSGNSIRPYTTVISSYSPSMEQETLPTYTVENLQAEMNEGYKIIYATVTLPENTTKLNHVWQSSTTLTSDGLPGGHPFSGDNTLSMGEIDFLSGTSTSTGVATNEKVHGLLNGVAWGILMPIGVIFARYVKVFADPTWFYLHVSCQCIAYGLGVAGVATGIKLGNDSAGITHTAHRGIGIALLCMATLQVFALLLRPNKDHKYRFFWNIYHRGIGYAVIILSAVNIFKGFDILNTYDDWKNAYIGILSALAGIALLLEVVTWIVFLRRKREEKQLTYANDGGSGGYSATKGGV